MLITARGVVAPPPSDLVKNPMVSFTNDDARTAPVLAMTGDAGGGPAGGDGALRREDGDGNAPAEASRLVIVVDDDRSIVEGLALLLEAWGYDVLTALSLNELAQRLPQAPGRPGLVLADHFLPAGGTGAQAVEMVRAHVGATVPALILTGDTMPERQVEAAAMGCRLLHKPVQIGPLKDMVDTLMNSAG
ncbi:response regulator receiver domain-containing protein [Azospirillum brasilense]|uniref:Response regulator receiver domain-containing protein n=2 Tax=Azospirillum brasilense TaxID=192 RepID=A0A560CHX6_AZOBR|nr:response regulator receiver domain-containing protein [Azospirillum brasilense]